MGGVVGAVTEGRSGVSGGQEAGPVVEKADGSHGRSEKLKDITLVLVGEDLHDCWGRRA